MHIGKELGEGKDAGGGVHMPPLVHVDQGLASLSKLAAGKDGFQLHISAGNVLCQLGERTVQEVPLACHGLWRCPHTGQRAHQSINRQLGAYYMHICSVAAWRCDCFGHE